MSFNLDNALHGVQEARTAVMLATADADTFEQEDELEVIQKLLNEAERKIKDYR